MGLALTVSIALYVSYFRVLFAFLQIISLPFTYDWWALTRSLVSRVCIYYTYIFLKAILTRLLYDYVVCIECVYIYIRCFSLSFSLSIANIVENYSIEFIMCTERSIIPFVNENNIKPWNKNDTFGIFSIDFIPISQKK